MHDDGSAQLARLRAEVRGIASTFGNDYYTAHAESGEFTRGLWDALGSRGLIGVNLPERYAGGGRGLSGLAAVCEETAAAGCPLLLLIVASAISGEVINACGTSQQREQWLPDLALGTSRMVFAITEAAAGSNAHRTATSAERDGDAYVLRGRKDYISGIDVADAVLVVARTGTDARTGAAELSLFVVDVDTPGLGAVPVPMGVSLPERQFTLTFDEVRVPVGRLIGGEGDGFRQVFHGLNPERVAGAALLVGMGRFALDMAAAYARERRVWDAPIGAHQGVAHPLAQARIEIEAAALMTERAARRHDAGEPAGEAANMAKFLAAEASLAAIDAAIQCHGGEGVAAARGLVPLWGLARTLRIAPVSREMILNYVAQHTLGLPKSY
jgi:alkylation response protein AidB-like acyl-CoA dehydrogenase